MRRSLAVLAPALAVVAGLAPAHAQAPTTYRPALTVPEELRPFLPLVEPGQDAFVGERDVQEIQARLSQFGDLLRRSPADPAGALGDLLAEDFRGGALVDPEPTRVSDGPLEIRRARGADAATPLDRQTFRRQLGQLLAGLREVTAAEFQVTSITRTPDGVVDTEVRYDVVGAGTEAWRVEHVGAWRLTWRRAGTAWRVVEWTGLSHLVSRARQPVFTEITERALGGNESFRRQLGVGLDRWNATIDSVLTRDSNGHHGVSVGDADGDGLDDLYVAQPAGLPNRLYRARGDGTFEDITEQSGLAVLDDTAQSLFADVDNDGDQDLVIATGTRMLLFVNDGTGRFTQVADAFTYARPLQGVVTSIAMADYDRDGFLDLYVCVYAYFFGRGEDKAGTPVPYYDARNGPPGVLFRNDGRGRFVDATSEAGLDEGNDRYHFAAVWADLDGDGWPDLFVANDFGTKNLYRNLGRRDGTVRFQDVAARAGVLDHGAGMSAAVLDYDNDGRLDIYAGNMWSASGLRVTAAPEFMPDAPADVRALYRRHARGNALFRNLGDGRFEDTTLEARANMGRWAWSSDALDFDSDGWDDLYVVNGMLTRDDGSADLDGFFWRQVVARSPLTAVKGAPYDDAWRAINQLLVHQSIASGQRNVLLRNDGRGGFDEVSGAVDLDLDQDGRSFAVFDIDGDGDPDLAVMAARQTPHLRIFRNDFAGGPASGGTSTLSVRLTGRESNRDAVGAVVTVVSDRLTRTRVVQAGSGFLSQHSKELLIGLGPSRRVESVTVAWPSGRREVFRDVAVNSRVSLTEGGAPEVGPLAAAQTARDTAAPRSPARPQASTWLYEPFPLPEFAAEDVRGGMRSLAALGGRPALLLLWTSDSEAGRAAAEGLAARSGELDRAGVTPLAIALDEPQHASRVLAATPAGLPAIHASRELGVTFAIVNRYLYMNRQPLGLPVALLVDAAGRIVKAYRGGVDAVEVARESAVIEATSAERLARALPFPGVLHSSPAIRNYLPYGRELLDEGLEDAALAAFERAAAASPDGFTLYRIGTLLDRRGETARARDVFERALGMEPGLAEASNDLGTLLARQGDLAGAIGRFRNALSAAPDYPDALNNLGYALLLSGDAEEARALYERALALQPDFPEALNNLGLLLGRAGALDEAERHFRRALALRADYGEAAGNVALVLVSRGRTDEAVGLLEGFLQATPQYEGAYVTLARIHLAGGRTEAGLAVLERLLQRNPAHPLALELIRQFRPR